MVETLIKMKIISVTLKVGCLELKGDPSIFQFLNDPITRNYFVTVSRRKRMFHELLWISRYVFDFRFDFQKTLASVKIIRIGKD